MKAILARLAAGERLAESEAEAAFGMIMAGEATPSAGRRRSPAC
jgi:anthranilate phosphoribosyltransferase